METSCPQRCRRVYHPGMNVPSPGNLEGIDYKCRVIDSVAFQWTKGGDMKLSSGLRTTSATCALVLAVMSPGGRTHANRDDRGEGHRPAKTLYIWAGDQARE